jgi:hypothetical protein
LGILVITATRMGIEMREEKVKYVELELNDPPLS